MTTRLPCLAIAASLCLGVLAAPAWAKAPAGGDIVIKRGTLRVSATGEATARGLVKWTQGASETPGVDCCTNRVYTLDGSGSFFDTAANRFSIVLSHPIPHAYQIDSYDANGAFLGSTFAPEESYGDYFEVVDDVDYPWWSYTGRWTQSQRSGAYRGGVTWTRTVGDSATFGPGASHSFGFVVTKGPAFGSAAVYLDGQPAGTIDCHAATLGKRKIALVLSPDRAGFDGWHELTIVNLATPGHPRLEIDAMAILWSD
jgi:hypothetical protein